MRYRRFLAVNHIQKFMSNGRKRFAGNPIGQFTRDDRERGVGRHVHTSGNARHGRMLGEQSLADLLYDGDTPSDESSREVQTTRKEVAKTKSKQKKDKRSRSWFGTLNNYTEEDIADLLNLGAKAYAFQEEISSTGTPHIQGVFTFRNPVKWSTINNKTHGRCWWDPCRNLAAARLYCQKKETRNGKQWTKGYTMGAYKIIDPLDGKKPYKWQQEVLDIVGLPCPVTCRLIYWYWSTRGNMGKSALVKHLVMQHKASYIGGKFSDAFYGIMKMMEAGKHPEIIIFDLPRSMGNKITYVGMEAIKNGMIYNTKYECKNCVFNPPHIIVFANEEPNMDNMSVDRWVIRNIDDETDV